MTRHDGPSVQPPQRQRWHHVRKLLAVRPGNVGEVLMSTPALTAIRECVPHAHVTLLASPAGAALAPHLDVVDDVLAYDAPWMKRSLAAAPQPHAGDDPAMVQRLAGQQFDAAVIFTSCMQSALPAALLCRLSGIRLRLAHSRDNPCGLLSDWVPDPQPRQGIRHEVRRQLSLVRAVGFESDDERVRLNVHSEDLASLCTKLDALGVTPKRPWVVVHPGAGVPSQRYPAASFGAAAQLIAQRGHCQVLFTGSADEAGLIASAQAEMRPAGVSLAGQLSLGELVALIAHASLVVSNNSAPVHIAAALGTPVVDLYALTSPQAQHDCPRLVTPMQVALAAQQLIERPAAPHTSGDEVATTTAGAARAGKAGPAVRAAGATLLASPEPAT